MPRNYKSPRGFFFKFCNKCEKKFQPTGRSVKMCDKCRDESIRKPKRKKLPQKIIS